MSKKILVALTLAVALGHPMAALAQQTYWTPWLNRDRPSGAGDYETFSDFLKAGQVCKSPSGIECQTTDGKSWQQTGQVYTCTQNAGGICANKSQVNGTSCLDYRVRFQCNLRWTPWLDRDNAGGVGDYETLQDFLKAGQACAKPVKIECQTTSGQDWTTTGQVYTCKEDVGGFCKNALQTGGGCLDYRVRFLCPQ